MSLWKAALIVIACVSVASILASGSRKNAVEARAAPALPSQQRTFVAAVETGRNAYVVGGNDMAKGAARPMRARAICSSLGSGLSVDDWIGTVNALSSNGDGKGVLEIAIGRNIFVKTWNNALSDIADTTLLEPDSSIYRQAVSLAVGQRVSFSGTFRDSATDCVKEASLTLDGSLTEPEFIFRFSRVVPWQAKAVVNEPLKCADREARENAIPGVEKAKRIYVEVQQRLAAGELTSAQRDELTAAMDRLKVQLDNYRASNPCL